MTQLGHILYIHVHALFVNMDNMWTERFGITIVLLSQFFLLNCQQMINNTLIILLIRSLIVRDKHQVVKLRFEDFWHLDA